jgi:hypothetical protein
MVRVRVNRSAFEITLSKKNLSQRDLAEMIEAFSSRTRRPRRRGVTPGSPRMVTYLDPFFIWLSKPIHRIGR